MAEITPANGQESGQNDQPQMMLQKIYVKDSSFEAPNAPQIFQEIGETQSEPEVQLNLSQESSKLADDVFEVVLTLTHRKLPDRGNALMVAGGWHTHLGILVDHLAGETTRPFWSSFLKIQKDYETRIPQ